MNPHVVSSCISIARSYTEHDHQTEGLNQVQSDQHAVFLFVFVHDVICDVFCDVRFEIITSVPDRDDDDQRVAASLSAFQCEAPYI